MRFFNRVSLSTPESVELEFLLAGIGSRTLALVIDYHVLVVILLLFWGLGSWATLGLFAYLEDAGIDYSGLPTWLLAIAILITFVIFAGYFVIFETLWQGQTPGKRWARIRVIRDDGRPVGLAQAALRALLRPIDDFLFIGVFLILLGSKEKRIGDWVAGTLVVQEERGDRRRQLLLSEPAQRLATRLAQQPELDQLLPDDLAIIREYLLRRNAMAANARSQRSTRLADQVRAILNLKAIPASTNPEQFLEAVYLAYQQRYSEDR
jgi:uncharacterized RDD family membrane protein YckC